MVNVNMRTVTLIIQVTTVPNSTLKRISIWRSANMCTKEPCRIATFEYQIPKPDVDIFIFFFIGIF